jgi:type IV pilus assembly protein PilM
MIALNRSCQHPIGLHLGPRLVRLMQLGQRSDARTIHAMAEAEIPSEESSAPELRVRETSAIIRRLLADHGFHGRQVVSCVGAQDLFVQNVRMPQLPPEEITSVLKWEAAERLPYPVEEAELRHIFAGPLRQDGNQKQEVILLACHRGVIERHVELLEQSGLAPLAIDLDPCAILRALEPASPPEEFGGRQAYLNFGEAATTVVFADRDQILFLKSIVGGGQNLDQAVAQHLELDPKEAVRMRAAVTSASTLNPADDVHRSVIDAIRAPLESVSAEVELCLRYYKVTFRGKPLDRIIVTGSEACPWLVEFLGDRLGTSCVLGNPLDSSKTLPGVSADLSRPCQWTTAFGLARHGSKV